MRLVMMVLALALTSLAPPAWSQDEEIVVTGSRIEVFDRMLLPQITLPRRADFAIVKVEVRSDTRDQTQRLNELRQALRGLEARARPDAVSLALMEDDSDYVREFSLQGAEEVFRSGSRYDTSVVEILLRTPISPRDTLESVRARIDAFLEASAKPGRVEMEGQGMSLSLREPNQYRPRLIAAILEDARAIAQALGADYRPTIGGLESQVAWRRVGDLDLLLFLPYTVTAAPAR